MFTKILIANRGEIACRIIATARRMGLRTVAVHSDANAHDLHVEMAHEAVRIGPAPSAQSYLDGEAIIAAARRSGAQAIHPGYGFLSENPEFVEAVEAAGLVFVGPPASAIRAMGLKDAAKALMERAGVPVVPGYHGADQSPQVLADAADGIGYPVLIKARAGGGGKGMRLVEKAGDFAEALASAQREGQAAFGDPAVLVEKYVTSPRHVEIQVFADGHGNVTHLFERDCSLQRRHQKVIEEAPAPGMTEGVRNAMGRAAVEAARAIGYVGAGTVEFIADGSAGLAEDRFWFMEMNTRLQVEHPVTEAITGLDLVELQLRIAAGAPLPFEQDDLRINGHAFEARLYAEDVPRGFLPATGRLRRLDLPPGAALFERGPVRVDAGVRAGDEISPWYDPMIAKLIVHGADRDTALAALGRALGELRIAGTVTNAAFLRALAAHEGFAAGEVDTGLIARDLAALSHEPAPTPLIVALAGIAALGALPGEPGPSGAGRGSPWQALRGWRLWGMGCQPVSLIAEGEALDLLIALPGPDRYEVTPRGAEGADTLALSLAPGPEGGGAWRVILDDHMSEVVIDRAGDEITVFAEGRAHRFTRRDPLAVVDGAGPGGDHIAAPMPGTVKLLRTEEGAQVAEGDVLVVLEAMKMEHALTAPRAGTVERIMVPEGAQVSDGDILLALAPADPAPLAPGAAGSAAQPPGETG
ncbi:acetyl-CoA carboxylase biotin carboxylase subunit [Profundibacterium mesophilum]|uniref:3-methylcrotonoyl-CoA carboxylase alpha subunit n=1 Tax=Profundibacterium mesophilum KAUST100406-0324 TaxID=1037889 RepID=A0A921TEP6_9RHOB|nr:acetyl/propionyl/methylcrotonyl-CoA carboxylase subunit alpha [Profundibacterium mesophilum]KAF0677532.1 3-methylcrotonoyl-CoA carboxylase alpha subunit [Profundibacterium mesophilum KAUST100406-0324]